MHRSSAAAVSNQEYSFDKPISYLNIFVESGVDFQISFDDGENFITVPDGFIAMPVGLTKKVIVTSDGAFQMVGVQA